MLSLYGFTFSAAAVSAYFVIRRILLFARKSSIFPVISFDICYLVVILFGVVVSRALFVLYHISYFSEHVWEIPFFWHGGWVWQGGMVGGLVGLFLYAKIKRTSFLLLTDLFAPGVALAQSIGRWGNYFNQELYGLPTNLPWGIAIEPQNRVMGYEQYSHFHPAFLYESIWDFGLFLFLYPLAKKALAHPASPPGFVAAYYFILSSAARLVIEFIRIDPVPVFAGLRVSQWWSIGFICLGILILLQRRKKMV